MTEEGLLWLIFLELLANYNLPSCLHIMKCTVKTIRKWIKGKNISFCFFLIFHRQMVGVFRWEPMRDQINTSIEAFFSSSGSIILV